MSISPACPLCKRPLEWDGEVYHCPSPHVPPVVLTGAQGLRITEEEIERERCSGTRQEKARARQEHRAARLKNILPVVKEP